MIDLSFFFFFTASIFSVMEIFVWVGRDGEGGPFIIFGSGGLDFTAKRDRQTSFNFPLAFF